MPRGMYTSLFRFYDDVINKNMCVEMIPIENHDICMGVAQFPNPRLMRLVRV